MHPSVRVMSTRAKRPRAPSKDDEGGEPDAKKTRLVCRHGTCTFSVPRKVEEYVLLQHEKAELHRDTGDPRKRCVRAECRVPRGEGEDDWGHVAGIGVLPCEWGCCDKVFTKHGTRRVHRKKKRGVGFRHIRCRDNDDDAHGQDAPCRCKITGAFPGCDAMVRHGSLPCRP